MAFFVPLRPPSLPFLDGPCWLLPASGSGDGDPPAASAFPRFFFLLLAEASPSSGSGEGDGDGDGDGDGVGDADGEGDGVGDADPLASSLRTSFFLGAALDGRGEGSGDGDGVGDADSLVSSLTASFFLGADLGADLDGRGEGEGEGVGDGDPFASPVPALLLLSAAGLDGRGEVSGEGVGEAVDASSSVALFFPFCLALSAAGAGEALVLLSPLGGLSLAWAVRAADEVAVRRVVSSGSLTSDAVVSSSISVSRFMADWRWASLRHLSEPSLYVCM